MVLCSGRLLVILFDLVICVFAGGSKRPTKLVSSSVQYISIGVPDPYEYVCETVPIFSWETLISGVPSFFNF